MTRYAAKGEQFDSGRWIRDFKNKDIVTESSSDPALKSLRTQAGGEEFPKLEVWWEYEPEDIMAYVYWHQGQLPPTGDKFEKEWKNIVKQLHDRHPIPADAEGHLDIDPLDEAKKMTKVHVKQVEKLLKPFRSIDGIIPHKEIIFVNYTNYGERAKIIKQVEKLYKYDSDGRSTNAPRGILGLGGANWIAFTTRHDESMNEAGGTGVFEPGDKYTNDFDYVGMLEWGANAPEITFDNIGTMHAASESFTDVNYHREGADLGNAIEWFEDTGPGEPRVEDFMKRFRAACAKTLEDIKR